MCTVSKQTPPLTTSHEAPKKHDRKQPPAYYHLLAEYQLLGGKLKDAIKNFEIAHKDQPQSRALNLKLLTLYISTGQAKKSRNLYAKSHKRLQADSTFRLIDATIDVGLKQIESARTKLKQLINDHPKFEKPYFLLASLIAAPDQTEQKRLLYRQLLKHVPNSFEAHKTLGGEFLASGDYDQAQLHLEKALSLNSNDLQVHVTLGFLYEKRNDSENAIKFYEEALHYNKTNLIILERLSALYTTVNSPADALRILRRMTLLLPKNQKIRQKMAFLYYIQDDYEHAATLFAGLLKGATKPDDRMIYYYGITLGNIQRYDEALRYLKMIKTGSPMYIGAIAHQVRWYKESNRGHQALVLLDSLTGDIREKPLFFDLYAGVLATLNKVEKAVVVMQEATQKFPDNIRLFFRLGIYQDLAYDREACLKTMHKALTIQPDYGPVLNYLGYLYVELNRNLDEAQQLLKRALASDQKNGYYLDSMGWLLVKRKKYNDGLALLKKALKRHPHESIILHHIADAYVLKGQRAKALKYFKRAYRYEKELTQSKTILRKIDRIMRFTVEAS